MNSGTPNRTRPPAASSRSNTTTCSPPRASCWAHARPAGPEPTTATRRPVETDAGCGTIQPFVPGTVDDRELDLLDRDGVALVDLEHARRLAGRRAEAPGELGEVVRAVQLLARLGPAVAVDEVVPVGDQVAERAAVVAERHAALHAARRLLAQLHERQRADELAHVADPLARRALGRLDPVRRQEGADLAHQAASSDSRVTKPAPPAETGMIVVLDLVAEVGQRALVVVRDHLHEARPGSSRRAREPRPASRCAPRAPRPGRARHARPRRRAPRGRRAAGCSARRRRRPRRGRTRSRRSSRPRSSGPSDRARRRSRPSCTRRRDRRRPRRRPTRPSCARRSARRRCRGRTRARPSRRRGRCCRRSRSARPRRSPREAAGPRSSRRRGPCRRSRSPRRSASARCPARARRRTTGPPSRRARSGSSRAAARPARGAS